MTRARYETVILVPRGDPEDLTRTPAEFDAIAERLTQAGISPLDPATAQWGDPSAPSLL
ncbi:MAG: hypothetical protein RML45_03145 [Acetobacteraceae bacterium]|nr:hypothetical protein [Acetobacteraceae bacterium]